MVRALIILLFTFSYTSAFSEEPLLFGAEFTFAVPLDENGEEVISNSKALAEISVLIEKKLKSSNVTYDLIEKTEHLRNFRISSEWNLKLFTDGGVVEAVMTPMVLPEYEKRAEFIQHILFDSAKEAGYPPALFTGGGHISISAQYFVDKPLLYRNFLVDLFNHSELALGIWNYDTNNALSPALYSPNVWSRLNEVLSKFDVSVDESFNKLRKFNLEIQSALVHVKDPYFYFWKDSINTRNKNSLVNLNHVFPFTNNTSRLELRAFRPQTSMDVFIRQIRLLRNRIQHLQSFDSAIILNPSYKKPSPNEVASPSTTDEALNPPVSPQWAMGEYYKYVTEAGENWSDHHDYLWPKWQFDNEVKRFNQYLKSCNGLFEPTP